MGGSLRVPIEDVISRGHFNTQLNNCVVEITMVACVYGPICNLNRTLFVPGPIDGGAPGSTEKSLADCTLPISGVGLTSNVQEECHDNTTQKLISRTQFEMLMKQYMTK